MRARPDVLAFNSFSPKETDRIHGGPETCFNCFTPHKQTGNFKMLPFNSILAPWRKRRGRKLSHINTLARTKAMATTPLVFDKDTSHTHIQPYGTAI